MAITVTLLRNRGLEKGLCYICAEAMEYSHAAQRRRELAPSRAASKWCVRKQPGRSQPEYNEYMRTQLKRRTIVK